MNEHGQDARMSTVAGEDLRGTRYVDCQLDGAEFREVTLVGARFIGSVMIDVEIDALVRNLTVNGVDVVPLVEAELDRRHPERLALRPTDVAGVLAALDVVDDLWAPTLDRLRGLPEELRHQRVRGEWSSVETLRHLIHVYDGWFGRAVLGETQPYNPLGLTASFLDPADFGIDPDLRPALDDVLAARHDRQQQVREHVRTLDEQSLTATIPTHGVVGFPPDEERSTLDCLRVIFDEEWAHHGFAARDLAELEGA
jgi:DinB superfamily